MKTPKKILSVITKGNLGGAQQYVFDLAVGMPKDRYETVVACGEGEALTEKLQAQGIRTIKIKGLRRNLGFFGDLRAFFSLFATIMKEQPDVLHLNSSKAGFLGACAGRCINLPRSRKRKIRVIFTGHGWAFNEDRSKVQKIFFFILHWMTIVLSHATIAVSERTADQVRRLPFVSKKLFVIHNGIAPFPLASQSESRHRLTPDTHERIWIGTISELHKNKGIDYLIAAFSILAERYANIALVLVGKGEEQANLQKLAEDTGFGERIHFTGFIPDARMYLAAFDIMTLTSRTEAFPYALLEAGTASLPVIASWAGGIPELITNGTSGILVDPKDTEALAEALEEFIADGEKRKTMGEALYQTVVRSFTIKAMVQATEKLYSR